MDDILIVGGGPAGLTAALYALRAGRTVTVLEGQTCGGQITHTVRIDNYPGLPGISGLELADRMTQQVLDLGGNIEPDRGLSLSAVPGGWQAVGEYGTYAGRALILASGTTHRSLGLPGEAELVGQGISFCAVCDGSFYKDRTVAVVGGGNAALADARYLAGLCRAVLLIHRRDTFRAEQAALRAVEELPNVKFLLNTTITAISNSEPLILTLQTPQGKQRLWVDGLFEAVGQIPDTELTAGLVDRDESGYLLAGEDCRTNLPGVFAAGDCRTKSLRQLTTALADGAVAATAACAYLQTQAN